MFGFMVWFHGMTRGSFIWRRWLDTLSRMYMFAIRRFQRCLGALLCIMSHQ